MDWLVTLLLAYVHWMWIDTNDAYATATATPTPTPSKLFEVGLNWFTRWSLVLEGYARGLQWMAPLLVAVECFLTILCIQG